MNHSIADIRKEYKLRSLDEADMAADPFEQFGRWWQEAIHSSIDEVNAMTLATATSNGKPSARIVLLKDYSENGFVFFTNYQSHKGNELAENPYAALVFFWKELERQVRMEGRVEKISDADSDAYYRSRPTGSRIGAWASPQSEVIADRAVIENKVKEYEARFSQDDIPRPAYWGGYVLKPVSMEFWQGRSNRLHDRFRYTFSNGGWTKERLAP